MKKGFLMLLAIYLSGCVSMSTTVFKKIHEGDSADKVIQALGKPDQFGPSQKVEGADAWYYVKGSEICGFTIKDNMVLKEQCGANQNYRNPASAFFQGFSEGMKNQQNNSMNCTSSTIGGITNTNCH